MPNPGIFDTFRKGDPCFAKATNSIFQYYFSQYGQPMENDVFVNVCFEGTTFAQVPTEAQRRNARSGEQTYVEPTISGFALSQWNYWIFLEDFHHGFTDALNEPEGWIVYSKRMMEKFYAFSIAGTDNNSDISSIEWWTMKNSLKKKPVYGFARSVRAQKATHPVVVPVAVAATFSTNSISSA